MGTRHPDTRPAQAARVADFLELLGCITKVLSDMPGLGYGLRKGWRSVTLACGDLSRDVRTYALLHRPNVQPDLFGTQ